MSEEQFKELKSMMVVQQKTISNLLEATTNNMTAIDGLLKRVEHIEGMLNV